jgi:hypothetical protein
MMKHVRKPSETKSSKAQSSKSTREEAAAIAAGPWPTSARLPEPRPILRGSGRQPLAGGRLIARTDAASIFDVMVVLAPKTAITRDELRRHSWVSPREWPTIDEALFAELYGASDEAIEAIRSLAAEYGLTVAEADRVGSVTWVNWGQDGQEPAAGSPPF